MRHPKVIERRADYAAPVVFGIFTTIGVSFIILAKIWGVGSVLVTTVPVLLMLAYAGMIIFARGLRLRSDQTGDNFYYMGFIFTLVSLGTSLYQYSTDGGVDDIIRNFGVAVASTIAGIILRIMFNQLRRDPIEFEQASRLDLSESVRKVRRELDGIQYEIAHFRRTNQQMVQEAFHESSVQLASLAKAATDAVEATRNSAIIGLEGTAEEISGNFTSSDIKRQLDRSSRSLDRVNTKLEQASEKLADAVDAFADRLVRTQTPDKIVEVSMQPAVEGLQQTISDAFDRLSQSLVGLERIADQVSRSAAQQNSINAQLVEIGRSVGELQVAVAHQRGGFLGMFGRRDVAPADGRIDEALHPPPTPPEVEPR